MLFKPSVPARQRRQLASGCRPAATQPPAGITLYFIPVRRTPGLPPAWRSAHRTALYTLYRVRRRGAPPRDQQGRSCPACQPRCGLSADSIPAGPRRRRRRGSRRARDGHAPRRSGNPAGRPAGRPGRNVRSLSNATQMRARQGRGHDRGGLLDPF